MRLIIFTFLISLLSIGCSKSNNCSEINYATNCVDSSIIDTNYYCTEQWDPVCGCNGTTYSNSCYATISGLTTYSPGECCQ